MPHRMKHASPRICKCLWMRTQSKGESRMTNHKVMTSLCICLTSWPLPKASSSTESTIQVSVHLLGGIYAMPLEVRPLQVFERPQLGQGPKQRHGLVAEGQAVALEVRVEEPGFSGVRPLQAALKHFVMLWMDEIYFAPLRNHGKPSVCW